MTKETSNGMDKNRRKFLKFMAIGGGAAVLTKVFGPRILSLFSSSKREVVFGNFRITEDKKELVISDQNGEKIFIIDKEK